LQAIAAAKVTVIEYDVVSGDAFNNDPNAIVRNVLTQSRPGSIIVMHITQANAPATAEALPRIIAGLRATGFEFRTVSALLGP
jgi:peptidoglycan/xylan/chitin deacetylase (PgdA/CDA1 family)